MKKIFILSVLLFSITMLNAQYTSSGVGTKFTPQMLADSAGAFFTVNGANYQLSNEIIISANDTLELMTGDTLFMASDGELRIEGIMIAMPVETFIITALDTTLGYEGVTFDESLGSIIQNLKFSYGGGVKLLYSDVHFNNCTFYKMTDQNGTGAVNMLQSNPVIENCDFIENIQSAIGSSATSSSSPVIIHNYLYRNNTENGNRPQINLGTSDGTNDIIIKHNEIEGYYGETGGISVATLAGGSASAVIDSNFVMGNRYGLNVQGNVDAQIIGNKFIDNNIEDNPMAGGSGISFYSGCTAIVSHNVITGNLWGITIPTASNPNLGQIGADTVNIGHNYIFDNGNGGVTYNLYNNSAEDIYAQNNYWGTTSATEAAEGIVDNADNSSLGVVYYEPIYLLSEESQILSFHFMVNEQWVSAVIDEENKEISADLPANTDISLIEYAFTTSDFASVQMSNDALGTGIADFTSTVTATVIAEDSVSSSIYDVIVTSAQSIASNESLKVKIYPNPTSDIVHLMSETILSEIIISDLAGRMILKKELNSLNESIETSSIISGVYILKLIDEKGESFQTKLRVE